MMIPQPLKSLFNRLAAVLFTTSRMHVTSLWLIMFARPTHWAYSKLILPCSTHACHLNTCLVLLQLFSINLRFQSANIRSSKRILSLCEFLFNIVYCIFPPIWLTKTIVIPLLFGSDVRKFAWIAKWCHPWHWCNFSRFESDNFEIWYFF